MTPLVSHTQLLIPTQPTLVATVIPGSNAARAPFHAVAPSVSNAAITPDHKGSGGYAGGAGQPAPQTPGQPANLSVPIPASFSTSSASLSASAVFAAQSLAQDVDSAPVLFANYEQLVEASLVKYKPSNAALPQPEVGNLYSKMLKEQKASNENIANIVVQKAVKEAPSPVPQQPAVQPNSAPAPKANSVKDSGRSSATARSEALLAASAYRATSARNQVELSDERVEAISG